MDNCTLAWNGTLGSPYGGGVYAYKTDGVVTNCVIAHNRSEFGGGLHLESRSGGSHEIKVADCEIESNNATTRGGGVYAGQGQVVVEDSCVSSNDCKGSGGGLYLSSGDTIVRSVIVGNTATNYGGGVYCYLSGETIENCLLAGNHADKGGAVLASGGSPILSASTLATNTATTDGSALWVGSSSAMNLTNCILWWNGGSQVFIDSGASVSAAYCDIQGGYAGQGNINQFPRFYYDYHHLLSTNSPCHDAGTSDGAPGNDLDQEARPSDGGVDIGCDEFTNSDVDKMPDWWEMSFFGSETAAMAHADADGDYVNNHREYFLGTDPTSTNMATDSDDDGLPDFAEPFHGTDTNDWDSDGDLFPDSWEVCYEYDPMDNSDPDPDDDDDEDGLTNFEEMRRGTDPSSSDTDGDGVSDGDEVDNGSDPADDDDQGDAGNCVGIELLVGDHSGSHSERYELLVGMVQHVSPEFGQVASNSYGFVRGKDYPFEVRHIDTDPDYPGPPWPDYDYTATMGGLGGAATWLSGDGFSVHDPQMVLGVHHESVFNYAAGKSGTLYVHGLTVNLEGHSAGRETENDPLAESVEENPGVWIGDAGAGEKKAKIVVEALGASGYERWLSFSDHNVIKLDGSVPSSNPMQVSGDSNADVSYEVTTNATWNIASNVTVSLSVKEDGETLPASDLLTLNALKVELTDPGRVAFTGATPNISFCLTPESWTNCSWEIKPYIESGGALFAAGSGAPGSNWYWGGTSVWVNPGTVATNYMITVHANELFDCDDAAGLAVSREISWTPAGSNIYVWKPVNDGQFCTEVIDELSAVSRYQGWSTNSVTWFEDPSTNDNNCGTCTLSNLVSMKDAGIVVVMTHGQTGMLEVARFLTETNAKAWLTGSATNHLYVCDGPGPATNYWSVVASADWFIENWKDSLDQKKSLVFLEVCHGADGAVSIAESVGGKAVFAVEGEQSGYLADQLFTKVVGYMNGTFYLAKPCHRPARMAFSEVVTQPGGDILHMEGDGRCTLCPAPQSVFPESTERAKPEWGCILFDTYMNGLVSANDAVIPTSGSISNRSWGSDGSGNYYVEFEFEGTGIGVEAVSNKCRSVVSIYEGRPLDGDAVAPMPTNGQSKMWSW